MKSIYTCVMAVGFSLLCAPVLAGLSGRELMDRADEQACSATSISRIDTMVQAAVVIVGQQTLQQPPQTNVVRIEIDRPRRLARQTATHEGKELILLKQGEHTAMKLGAGPWEIPTGPFANLAKDVGDLFVCERETPETAQNAPVWKVVGTNVLDSQEMLLVGTEGNTLVPLAQERMTKNMAKGLLGSPAQRPTVKVLEYASKHWISKAGYRRLQAVQKSKVQMTMPLPDGTKQVMEISISGTSKYCFDPVRIEIPAEAQTLLLSKPLPSPTP